MPLAIGLPSCCVLYDHMTLTTPPLNSLPQLWACEQTLLPKLVWLYSYSTAYRS